jgi:hypothetical protein
MGRNDSKQERHGKKVGEETGYILIRGFWSPGTDCIIDFRVTDLDAKSNVSWDPHKLLLNAIISHIRGLHRWSFRRGRKILTEEAILRAFIEMGEAVFWSVWICQRSYEHCHCSSHAPLSPRLSYSNQPYEKTISPVGRSGRTQLDSILVITTTSIRLARFSHCLVINHESRVWIDRIPSMSTVPENDSLPTKILTGVLNIKFSKDGANDGWKRW